MNPHFYHIGQYDWDYFGTLTYCPDLFFTNPFDCRVGAGKRKSAAFRYLRFLAKDDGRHFKNFQWVLREETGESFGRPHHHFLIRNKQKHHHLNIHHCKYLEWSWNEQTQSLAKIRPFHKWIDGAGSYLVKSANGYEQRKFGEAIDVEFSNAFNQEIINNQTYDTVQKELYSRSEVLA